MRGGSRQSQHTLNEAHFHLFGSVGPDPTSDMGIGDDGFGLDGEIDLGIGMEAFGELEGVGDEGVGVGVGDFGEYVTRCSIHTAYTDKINRFQPNFDGGAFGGDDPYGFGGENVEDQVMADFRAGGEGMRKRADLGLRVNRLSPPHRLLVSCVLIFGFTRLQSESTDPGGNKDKENFIPSSSVPPPSARFQSAPLSNIDPNAQHGAFLREGSTQPGNQNDDEDEKDGGTKQKKRVKAKKRKLEAFIDSQIELSNGELLASREHYEEEQKKLAREAEARKKERDAYQTVLDMVWAVPRGCESSSIYSVFHSAVSKMSRTESWAVSYLSTVDAPEIADLWKETFKAHIEARSGGAHLDNEFAVPRKLYPLLFSAYLSCMLTQSIFVG